MNVDLSIVDGKFGGPQVGLGGLDFNGTFWSFGFDLAYPPESLKQQIAAAPGGVIHGNVTLVSVSQANLSLAGGAPQPLQLSGFFCD